MQEKYSGNGRARLGVDIGALFAKAVLLDENGRVLARKSLPHKGEIYKVTHAVVKDVLNGKDIGAVRFVGHNAPAVAKALGFEAEDQVSAIIRAVREELPKTRLIIDIGGGSLSLIELDENGDFSGYQTNTLCAAGTGSFLDEQAARLGLDYDAIKDFEFVSDPPSVAARCAVFAKSDLIHRQQEGYGKPEMWSGLCKGLTHTIVMTLFKGRQPKGQVAVVGGVARNPEVMRWLREDLGLEIRVPEAPQEFSAFGAALSAEAWKAENGPDWEKLLRVDGTASEKTHRPSLELHRSDYPSFSVEEAYIDDEQNEVRVTRWPDNNVLRGYIGIDIGSTSTKLLMTDGNDEALVDIYRKTGGDPIHATKALFRALRTLIEAHGGKEEILGVGTTGSGRKLVGAVIGADAVINEITAHVTGAMKTDPSIDTIFEIGGQDAKYIHAKNGRLHNSNMNYVCAAGTGSFVEELSRKLGFDLFTLGDEVMGVRPPVTSDRCTVFMEQDAQMYLRRGYSPKEVMGAVMYSVVQNYLNKVVGTRYYSREKVFFQGATARNKGLVAAFENLLGVEVVVSPYCHVMGSWGVALLTRKQVEASGKPSRFVGLSFAEKEVKLSTETCELCNNHCHITFAEVEGLSERPSWGYLCGRDAEEKKVKLNREFDLFRQRNRLWNKTGTEDIQLPKDAPVIGYPRALLAHSYYPFWRRFFAELGYRLKLSKPTDRDVVELSSEWVGSDYCFPVKLAHGHARQLLENDRMDRIFIPYMVSAGDKSGKTTESYFCPYNVALPATIEAAMNLNGVSRSRLLRATMDFRWTDELAVKRLYGDLGAELGRSRKEIAGAWKRAYTVQKHFENGMMNEGGEAYRQVLSENRPAIVILGRPYNIYDPGANLNLPEKIARLGFPVIPIEFLPLAQEDIGEEFHNMFWNFGRKIIEAARIVARTPNLYAVYFSNFSCGPDSFIQTYVEEIMGVKPMLMLELDEHGADAGYVTRLEAFSDVIKGNTVHTVPRLEFIRPPADKESLKDRTLWVPPMAEGGTDFVAATFRRYGYNARGLPRENREAFLKGRANTRGGECLPCPATLGSFLSTIEKEGLQNEKHALFMPTATGPCRFGQYCTLDRIALDRQGMKDIPMMSWASEDSYGSDDKGMRRDIWRAFVLHDVLFKVRCRIRPYEINPGETEALYQKWIERFSRIFMEEADIDAHVRQMRNEFNAIARHNGRKPLVGLVGEIYVRSNRFTNQDVVRRVEDAGGEAWLAPLSEWVLYLSYMEEWVIRHRDGKLMDLIATNIKNRFLAKDENHLMELVSPILDDRHEPPMARTMAEGERFVPADFEGEVILTLGRAVEFMKNGASLVVNCAPFGCMPGAITSGIFQQLEAEHGVPVANMFYDGEGDINDIIDTYLANIIASDPAYRESAAWHGMTPQAERAGS